MSTVTIFQKYEDTNKPHYRHINHILNRIKTGANKELVYKIRSTGEPELKKQLPCILFSGSFSYRNAKSIIQHSGFICLDFDKFPDHDTLLTWKDTLEGDIYTYCVFLSPSGNGLKVIVKIPSIKENHKGYFAALKDHYQCEYFDKACSDICRICYESYDPFLTINQDSAVWDTVKVYERKEPVILEDGDDSKAVKILLKWWLKKYGPYSGQRNNNMFILCAAFNNYGIPRDSAFEIASTFQQEGFSVDEIQTTLNSAYKNTSNFGTLRFANNG